MRHTCDICKTEPTREQALNPIINQLVYICDHCRYAIEERAAIKMDSDIPERAALRQAWMEII